MAKIDTSLVAISSVGLLALQRIDSSVISGDLLSGLFCKIHMPSVLNEVGDREERNEKHFRFRLGGVLMIQMYDYHDNKMF